jgi:hypothetical protein
LPAISERLLHTNLGELRVVGNGEDKCSTHPTSIDLKIPRCHEIEVHKVPKQKMCPKFQSKQSHVASHHTLPRCRVCENAKVSGTNGPEWTWPFELAMELWENHGKIMGKLEHHGKITGKSWENRGKYTK